MRLSAIFAGLLLLSGGLLAQDSPYDARRAELGVELDDKARKQAVIASVEPDGPAARAGLLPGDVLLRLGEQEILGYHHFLYLEHFKLPPGQATQVVYLRDGVEAERSLEAGSLPIIPEIMAAGGRTRFLSDEAIFPQLEEPDLIERGVHRLLERQGLTETHAHLRQVLTDDVRRKAGFFRLERMAYAERNPARAHRVGRALAEDLRHSATERFQDLPARAWGWLDVEAPPEAASAFSAAATPEAVLEELHSLFDRAARHRERAFAGLTGEEQAFLRQAGTGLTEDLTVSLYIHWEGQRHLAANKRVIRLARKVDFASLAALSASVSPLWDVDALRRLADAIPTQGRQPAPPDAGITGTVLAWRETPYGLFVVGGPGPNTYATPCALIIDVGGDDTYTSSGEVEAGLSAIIDLAGADRYVAPEGVGAQGAGLLGAGLLVDLSGDDLYQLKRLGQGVGYFGFGLLLDAAGNDTYAGGEMVQGAGLFGVGAHIDLAGEDRYQARLLAQGFGGPKGLGLLYEGSGPDRYQVGGTYPSSYGTKDVFRGHGQGMGLGFRHTACGGFGVLLDRAGDDRYQAGNFSQGTGYYMAMGVLVDDAGDDAYQVTRYGQGVGCHSAVGVMIEGGGNDQYQGAIAANQGAAWDAGVGVLLELGGDDTYKAPGLSLGAAAMNGFALLFEAGGVDTYRGKKRVLGFANSNDYWWGRGGAHSLGILMELASAGDDFGESGRTPGQVKVEGARGVFFDSPDDLLALLKDDPDVQRLLEEREARKAAALEAERLAQRDQLAHAGYQAALVLYEKKQYERAIAAFEAVAHAYGDVPWGLKAKEQAAAIANDPSIRALLEERAAATECQRLLSLGKTYYSSGQLEGAAGYFQQVVEGYPDTEYAREAAQWLQKIGKGGG